VLVHVSFTSFFTMVGSMMRVATGGMGVMSCLLVATGLVMFGRFGVVARSVGVMFGGLLMVLSSFRGHLNVSSSQFF
jgi:hypothetical protein